MAAGRNKAQISTECFVWPYTAIPVHRDRRTIDSTISALWAQHPQTRTKTVPLLGQGTNDVHKKERGKAGP